MSSLPEAFLRLRPARAQTRGGGWKRLEGTAKTWGEQALVTPIRLASGAEWPPPAATV
jgi:hypothetical protein